jgi:hypothetical protein
MDCNLHWKVRRAYSSVASQRRDTTAAFESAVRLLTEQFPTTPIPELRMTVARMLSGEPGEQDEEAI